MVEYILITNVGYTKKLHFGKNARRYFNWRKAWLLPCKFCISKV